MTTNPKMGLTEQHAEAWHEAGMKERSNIAGGLLLNEAYTEPGDDVPCRFQLAAEHVDTLHDDRRRLLAIVGRLIWSDGGYSSTDFDRRDNELLIEAFDAWKETK